MSKLDAVKEIFFDGRRTRVTEFTARRIGFALGVLGLTETEATHALDNFDFPQVTNVLHATAMIWFMKGSRPVGPGGEVRS